MRLKMESNFWDLKDGKSAFPLWEKKGTEWGRMEVNRIAVIEGKGRGKESGGPVTAAREKKKPGWTCPRGCRLKADLGGKKSGASVD